MLNRGRVPQILPLKSNLLERISCSFVQLSSSFVLGLCFEIITVYIVHTFIIFCFAFFSFLFPVSHTDMYTRGFFLCSYNALAATETTKTSVKHHLNFVLKLMASGM